MSEVRADSNPDNILLEIKGIFSLETNNMKFCNMLFIKRSTSFLISIFTHSFRSKIAERKK